MADGIGVELRDAGAATFATTSEDDGGEAMENGPQDRTEDRRRRTGPLGETGDDPEATRRVPASREAEDTQPVSQGEPGREGAETRVIRTPGSPGAQAEEQTNPRGYFEANEEREERLRDIYGGVDWLASFVGCLIAVVTGLVLLALAGLVLVPLGFTLNLEGREIGAAIITGLVVVGVVLFLAYLFGGYVAGRMARFDGGRNGMMSVAWSLALVLLVAAVGSFLPGRFFDVLQEFVQNTVLPTVGGLTELGLAGAGIIAGALLLALLGGFFGGRLGSRYHSAIDGTT
ncbi:hypothetical protein GBA65_12465 [Rubrobacter marinus]|uniref:Uncharacterized protein n=1 Tax=Rubrobacter marinus TaxID=2653852 RepID=A0A6G8PY99_9ACTN|nr:hypothetical protein [Rubrobacter marinus]QIN79199.1 hypothetical protein GBA65_12465 [Rubrobacter marinus]